jgi:transposase-like protein
MWRSESEGAKFWLNVLTELQDRAVKDILIACLESLKDFPNEINSVSQLSEVCFLERLQSNDR